MVNIVLTAISMCPPVFAGTAAKYAVAGEGQGEGEGKEGGKEGKGDDWQDEGIGGGGQCVVCLNAPREVGFQVSSFNGFLTCGFDCLEGLSGKSIITSCGHTLSSQTPNNRDASAILPVFCGFLAWGG